MSSAESHEEVISRIRHKRLQLEKFLSAARPRKRLINTTIVGGSIAAALTAAPALGGQSFTAWLTGALGLTSPAWRILCAASGLIEDKTVSRNTSLDLETQER